MIKKKGEYGYRKYFKIKNGIMICFFIIVILVLFIASKHTKENMSRILLVSSILMVLPMANLLSPFLVVFKYRSCEYDLVKPYLEDKHFLFDIILTMKEQVMPLDIIYIDGERIFCVLSNKADKRKTEDFIKERMKLGGISVNVKVCESINELKKFIKISQTEENVDNKLNEIRAILKSLSV
jgi:O-linked glcNAc transferase-like protein